MMRSSMKTYPRIKTANDEEIQGDRDTDVVITRTVSDNDLEGHTSSAA